MDRPEWQVTTPSQAYPSHHGINDNSAHPIIHGYAADWCSSSPGTIALLAQGGAEYSGISTTGGTYNSWTPFTNLGTPPAGSAGLYSGGTIACSTPSNIVWELGNAGGLYYTTNGGTTWSASNTGLSQNDLGWHGGNFLDRQNVVADRVDTNVFYAYNSGTTAPGIYKSTDGGATFATTAVTGHFDNGDRFNAQMRSVPGNAGNFYYTSGNDTPAGTQGFYECTDTNPSGAGTVACNPVPNVTDVWSFGFGKAKPSGSGYPTIFIYGAVNGVFGLWRSDDHHATWAQVSGASINNSLDQIRVVEGDSNAYGRVYVGFTGSGYAYGDTANAQVPPSLSSITTSGVPTSNATITWSTDQSSNSKIVYGTTSAYGSATSSTAFVTSHSLTLTGLSPLSVAYHYAVVSTNAQGYTATSTDQTFTTFNNIPPSVPNNLAATATSTSEIDLSWSASTGNGTYSVAGYQIFRNGSQVATTTSGTTYYADTGLTASTTYTYAVDAYDTGGNVSALTSGVSTSTQTGVVTFTPGPSINGGVINAAFANTTETFTGLNGGTNFPSGAVVIVGLSNDLGSTPSSPTIGGQAATLVSGSNASSGKCTLYQATMPTSEPDTFSFGTGGGFRLTGVVDVGYFRNLTSHTVFSVGNEVYGGQADPQSLSTTLTVPSNGFGVAYVWSQTTPPTALSWTNTTLSSGDNFESSTTSGFDGTIGSAHTATAGAGWNPIVSGVTNPMNYAACMSAGTWH